MTHLLTLNVGSATIKFAAYALEADALSLVLRGKVDRLGGDAHLDARRPDGSVVADRPLAQRETHDPAGAMAAILGLMGEALPGGIAAVGHRVVHGADGFAEPVVIDAAVMTRLAAFATFAPLHQPHNLAGIDAARAAFPDAVQIACFDTAFHRGRPFVAETYALPRDYYQRGVRRYGFHGLSYDYIAGVLARDEPALAAGRVIVAHLGSGASMCAMAGGRSVDTTMGFSALDGLVMGTRCGAVDPGVLLYLLAEERMDPSALSELLYRRSGLLGLSGLSADMRVLEAAGTLEADEAIDHFVRRAVVAAGGLAAALGGLDGLVFTAGIGEGSARVRAGIADGLGFLGVRLNAAANGAGQRIISAADSTVRTLVLPTDEEHVIAEAVARAVGSGERRA